MQRLVPLMVVAIFGTISIQSRDDCNFAIDICAKQRWLRFLEYLSMQSGDGCDFRNLYSWYLEWEDVPIYLIGFLQEIQQLFCNKISSFEVSY